MGKILKSFVLLASLLFFSSASCEDNSPNRESIDFQFLHNVPGSCPTYFFNTLDTHESHIPTKSSNAVIESFLQAHPDAAKVKISLKKTGKIIQHECGDREANPKLHPFIEIEIFSITEI
jgi:hypothetical protein